MMKYLTSIFWIPFILLHTFPALVLWPFTGWTWWLLAPVGLVPLGLVAVPLALMTRHLTVAASKKESEAHWPHIFWLWGNDEEGCPDWWKVRAAQEWYTRYWPEFWWYAVRNPVNNFRFLFDDVSLSKCYLKTNWQWEVPMEAQQLREAGKGSAFYYIQHGWKSGFRRVWLNDGGRYSEFWIGWKLASGVPGLGFAMQLRLKRKIGT